MKSLLIFLIVIIQIDSIVSSDSGITQIGTDSQDLMRDMVKNWTRDFSGKPVSCVPGQFLFTGNVIYESSNETKISSLSRLYQHCKTSMEDAYNEMEIFITSPLYFSGYSVSFSRTILLLTHNYCRLASHGITTFTFLEDNFKIRRWQDFYDANELKNHLAQCQFPIDTESTDRREEL